MSDSITREDLDQLGDRIERKIDKRFDRLEKSLSATDAVVTALYAELVQNRPNVRDRLHTIEINLAKVITITPGAGELRQPIYDAGDVA